MIICDTEGGVSPISSHKISPKEFVSLSVGDKRSLDSPYVRAPRNGVEFLRDEVCGGIVSLKGDKGGWIE